MIRITLCVIFAGFVSAQGIKTTAKPVETPARQAATPKPTTAVIPNTDDIEPLIRQLVAAGSGKKDEFETTAQFQARQANVIPKEKIYAFAPEHYDYNFEYDADKAVMRAHVLLTGGRFENESSIWITTVVRRTEDHVGMNSFGAKTVFISRFSDEFGVVISKESDAWLRSFLDEKNAVPPIREPLIFSFPMEIERAKEMKANLRLVLIGTVPDTGLHKDHHHSAATISDPIEATRDAYYANFSVSEVRVVDARTGQPVAQFKMPSN